jgi:hypothetical protein
MSFLRSIFQRKKDDDYENVLSNLVDDIRKRQIKLSEIRLRERRATLLVTLYTLAAWGAYISLWYTRLLPDFHAGPQRPVERVIKAIPVFIGPIIVLFIRRIVQIWYQRKGDAEEKTLRNLIEKHGATVEEIKKKTKYYSTQALLSKYDVTPASSPMRPKGFATPLTPQRSQSTPQAFETPTQIQPRGQPHLAVAPSPLPSTPPHKQWYDKLADALLGDDDLVASAPSSRYALICENCFAHNGLVKESMWEHTQYICPKCNHFNPAPISKKGSSPTSPLSSNRKSSPEPLQTALTAGREAESGTVTSPSRPTGEAGPEKVDS